jgi:hypothetical protein
MCSFSMYFLNVSRISVRVYLQLGIFTPLVACAATSITFLNDGCSRAEIGWQGVSSKVMYVECHLLDLYLPTIRPQQRESACHYISEYLAEGGHRVAFDAQVASPLFVIFDPLEAWT